VVPVTIAPETLTAPLPPAAVEAQVRVESHFPLIRAVAQYETAAVHAVQLAALAAAGRL
jgi:hypothetical protein